MRATEPCKKHIESSRELEDFEIVLEWPALDLELPPEIFVPQPSIYGTQLSDGKETDPTPNYHAIEPTKTTPKRGEKQNPNNKRKKQKGGRGENKRTSKMKDFIP